MPSYFIYTFGCQMNVHDSRWIEQVLREKGYACSDCAERADLIIFNTCSVRAKAEQKLFSEVGTFRELKRARPELVIAIAGCMAQQHGRTLLLRQPIVDVVLGPDQISALPDLVDEARSSHRPLIAIERELEKPRFLRAKLPFHSPAATSFVTIMKGCDERCSFCIVPYTRGAERYRPADEIIDEIARLVARGVREVTLLGQTVNAWREPDSGHARRDPGFSALLRRVASDVPELIRLRYTSPHPRHVSAPLVQAHGELSVLPDHLHLPVQSGSDRVLKRMMRRHTREQYLESAFALKRARPGLALSTDLIVGFPGETDRDFTQTLSLVREVGFVSAYAFKYSPRPMTPALKLGDEIPEAVKEERLAELLALVESQQMAHLESLVGQRVQVLVEGPNGKDPSHVTGRSQRHEIVHVAVPPGSDLTGQLIDVVVQHANKHSLMASLTSLSFRALSDGQ